MKQTLLSLLTLVLLTSFSNRLYARDSYPLYAVVNGTEMTLMCTEFVPSGCILHRSEEWFNSFKNITHVVVDESCRGCNKEDLGYLFHNFTSLVSITGLENLNTNSCVSMQSMFSGCKKLVSVDVSSFVTRKVMYMDGMFSGCEALTSLDLRSFDTSEVTNMRNMFKGCSALTSLDLTSFNTSNVISMESMFSGCQALASLDLTSFDTSKVNVMSSLFNGCLSLTSLDLTSFNTSEVVYMSGMFTDCRLVESLDLSSFNTSNVTDMLGMFSNCRSLKSLDLSSFNTRNVTRTTAMFSMCSSLISLNVSNFDTSNVTDMGGMFHGCSALTSLDVSNFNTSSATSMSSMFHGCSSLTSLDISVFNTASVTNMSGMFSGCSSLTTLDVSTLNTAAVTDMSSMFSGLASIKGIENLNTSAVTNMSGMFGGLEMPTIDLSSFNTSNVTNMSGMFRGCRYLTNLDLSTFDTSNVTDMNFMFSGLWKMKVLDLRPLKTSSVKNMDAMFLDCRVLKTILIGEGWDTRNVTSSKLMFSSSYAITGEDGTKVDRNVTDKTCAHAGKGGYMCTQIPPKVTDQLYAIVSTDGTSMTIKCDEEAPEGTYLFSGSYGWTDSFSAGITSAVIDASCKGYSGTTLKCLFCNFPNLATITDLGNLNTEKVENMSAMFDRCSALTSIDLASFNTSNVTDMSRMFSVCSSLASIDLISFNTSNVTNMESMFDGCSSITALDLSKFNTENVANMNRMFRGLYNVKILDLSSFSTAKVTDMSYMFENCSAMKTICIGKDWDTSGVKTSEYMFSGCTSLIGADGTRVNRNQVDKTCAHYGEGGYLSSSIPENYNDVLYVEISADGTAVTLKCGDSAPEGTVRYTGLPGWAEEFCSDITSVTIDASCKAYLGTELRCLFENFISLTTITGLENLNSAGVNSMSFMFSNCSSLTTISGLEKLNTSSVTDMQSMFRSCRSITNLDLSSFNTERVENMCEMFWHCENLTTITGLDKLNTASVTDMHGMFSSCALLTSLDFSSFNTAKVKNMSEMFNGCNALVSIVGLDKLNTASVTDMSYMFHSLWKIKLLDLRSFNTARVNKMDFMFSSCMLLRTILIGDGWDTSGVNSSISMFGACNTLEGDDGTKVDPAVIDKSCAHSGTGGYLSTKIPAKITAVLYAEFSDDGTTMTIKCDDEAPDGTVMYTGDSWPYDYRSTVTSINIDASCEGYSGKTLKRFICDFPQLTSVKGLNHLNTTTVTNMSGMLSNCPNLTELDLSALNTDNVTDMSWMFSGNSSLGSIDLSKFNTDKVTDMRYMFSSCKTLTKLDLSKFNTDNVTNMANMFNRLSNVRVLDLSSFNTTNVTDMSWMFSECTALKTICIGKGWDTSGVTKSEYMFYKCTSVIGEDGTMYVDNLQESYMDKTRAHNGEGGYMSSAIPDSYKDILYAEISSDGTAMTLKCGDFAPEWAVVFAGNYGWADDFCQNINIVTIDTSCKNYKGSKLKYLFGNFPKLVSIIDLRNLNTENVTNMENMFYGCSSLTSLDLSAFNTARVVYMSYMFDFCRTLETIYVGDQWSTANVNKFGMFSFCEKLIGGQGTTYSSAQTQSDYARVDGGAEAPGYLTHISDKPETEMESMVTEVTVSTESLANESLNNNIVDDVYYNVGEDSYDAEDQSIVISKPTDMDQIVSKEPGSGGVKFKFTGLIMKAAEGIGSITVNAKTSGNAQLALQVGDEEPKITSCNEQGDVTMPYVVSEDTYIYVYSVTGKNTARSTRAAANEVRLYSVTIVPDVSYIKGDASFDGMVNAEDVVEMVNGMMGNMSDNYSSRNADANRDGVVDIGDILWITNKIVSSPK